MDHEIKEIKQIGQLIKLRRKELGVTQKELADFANMSHNGISRIEVGESNVRISTLLKISEMLGYKIILKPEEDED